MKGLMFGIALGMATGLALSQVPQVKQILGKGKKTLKDVVK